MKGLLHSKKFRINLYKWLFMYVGVMGLFTTVITYSKYVSSMMASDSARVASFAVSIDEIKCSEDVTSNCNSDKYRSTSQIDYYFTVDTTKLEVKTELYLTLYVNSSFDIVGDIKETNIDGTNERVVTLDKNITDENIKETNFKVITIKNDNLNIVEAGKGTVKRYKVSLKYNKKSYEQYEGKKEIIKVGYSATQLAK